MKLHFKVKYIWKAWCIKEHFSILLSFLCLTWSMRIIFSRVTSFYSVNLRVSDILFLFYSNFMSKTRPIVWTIFSSHCRSFSVVAEVAFHMPHTVFGELLCISYLFELCLLMTIFRVNPNFIFNLVRVF